VQDTLDYLVQEQRRKRRQTAVFAVLVVLAGGWWALGDRVSALFSGEKNWQGDPVFEAQAPSMLGDVDLRRVHEELLPNWTVALAWVDRQGPEPATAALQVLQAAVASDENLRELLAEVAERVRGDLWEEGERLIFLTSAWSQYLDAQHAPWRIEGGVVDLGSGPFFYVKVYEILADGAVGVGGQPSRIRLMRRADTLNIREAHLGHVVEGEDAGMVVLDRIEKFAADALWPLLDPSGQRALDRLGAAHGAAVRAEAASVLPAEDLALLQETARERLDLVSAVLSVSGRGCDFRFNTIPWQGFDAQDRDMLGRAYREDLGARCPAITRDEIQPLLESSEVLRNTRDLDRALASLVGWAARSTAAHEARHVADHGQDFDPIETELSAYLASFSTDGISALSFFQACRANVGVDGTHARALALSGLDCETPPWDLQAQARVRSREAFDHADLVVMAADFARSVPVSGD
jgi:hypothetical protein